MDKKGYVPLGKSVTVMVNCLQGLGSLKSGRTEPPRKTYSGRVELMADLTEKVRGWQTVRQEVFDDSEASADLWTDVLTGKRILVVMKKDSPRKFFPMMYVEVDEKADLSRERVKSLIAGRLKESSVRQQAA